MSYTGTGSKTGRIICVTTPRDKNQDATSAARNAVSLGEIFAGAAHSRILARCRHIYFHELRSALNPGLLTVELLSKAAGAAAKNPALLEQSSTLAKRAMGILDKSTVELFDQILIAKDPPSAVNLGTMLEEILRLLRPDMDLKTIEFQFSNAPDLGVRAPAFKLRLFLLGLIATTIDELPEASQFSVTLAHVEGNARIEVQATIDFPRVDAPAVMVASGSAVMTAYALILVAAQQWFATCGGGLECQQGEPSRLRIYLPLESARPELKVGGASIAGRSVTAT
jgi:hypothetical protein